MAGGFTVKFTEGGPLLLQGKMPAGEHEESENRDDHKQSRLP